MGEVLYLPPFFWRLYMKKLILGLISIVLLSACFFGDDEGSSKPSIDPLHYALLNDDLTLHFGDDKNELLAYYQGGAVPVTYDPNNYINHYNTTGSLEARPYAITLPADYTYLGYIEANPDLAAFDQATANNHYLTAGMWEGRGYGAVVVIPPDNRISRIGFIQAYAISGQPHVDEIDINRYTQINLFSVEADASGNVNSQAIDRNIANINLMVTVARNAGVKVWMTLGGAGKSDFFHDLAVNPAASAALITNLVTYLDTNNYDGLDIDWEFPETQAEADWFAVWLGQLKAAMGDKKLSIDIPTFYHRDTWASEIPARDAFTAAFDAVDEVNIMAYDMAGLDHSNYTSTNLTIDYFKSLGLDMAKTNLGVPFYAKNKQDGGDMTWEYFQIYKLNNPIDKVVFTPESERIEKVNRIIDEGMAGIMYWEASHDSYDATSLAVWYDEQLKARGK